MKKIKVRGIYSTALSKFLLDNGYKLVLPSEKQMKRFGIDRENYPIDASILDYNLGIKIVGPSSEEIAKKIHEEFDSIYFEDFVGRIYRGKVLGSLNNSGTPYVVKIGKYIGILNEPLLSENPVVQIKKEEQGWFHLTQEIRVFGKYVVLIKDGKNSFHKDFPEEEKKKFEDIKIEGFGIFFTQFAIGREREEIEEDIKDCLKRYKEIFEGESYSFKRSWILKFTKEGREKLDNIRKSVLPTAKKHHLIRMLGLDGKLDVIEELAPERIDILERELNDFEIEVIHDRLIGGIIVRKERVLEKKDGFLRTYREIKSSGFYDGLKVRKYPGDYVISEMREGEIYYKMSYYRKDGKLIGEYINFNTPIEMFGNKVYYVDLFIDLVHIGDRWLVIDTEELERFIEECSNLEKYKKDIFEKIKEICGGENYEIEGS